MELQAENCAKCGCLPDDILTLTCGHDLCLSCAAKNLVREMRKYGDSTKAIMCELCGAPTILDESSVEELLRIPVTTSGRENSWVYSPARPYSGHPSPNGETKALRTPYNPGSDGPKFQGQNLTGERAVPYSEMKTMRAFCIEHPDEEISYFCFDCLSNCICPECVIHGPHKNHEVLTVKKSYNIVKSKVEDVLNNLNVKLDEERMLEDKFNSSKREMRENNKLLKKQVSDIFQEIRNRIEKKEKEILTIMDSALEDAVKEVDLFMKSLENKAAAIGGTFELVKNHLAAKDEVLLLNFYANTHEKLKQQLESEEANFKKAHDSFVPKVPMNFNEIIDSLNILQLQISAIGNVDPDKFRNYPASGDYLTSQHVYEGYDGKENKSRLKRDPSKKDQFLTALSSYTTNMNQIMGASGQKLYNQDSFEKGSKPTNFRNFQNPSTKNSMDNKGGPYQEKYK